MRIKSLLEQKRALISFEFFPPKTDEGMRNLLETISSLKSLSPSFVSMTYGAGGSTRAKSVELVSTIKNDIGLEAAAHLTCVGHTRTELKEILNDLKKKGVDNIIALRGDPPKGQSTFTAVKDGFRFASELVKFVREQFDFSIGVAGYPEKHIESPSIKDDLAHLKEKVVNGGDFIITQLFFDNTDYFSYVERLQEIGVRVPVVAGIMPITDFEQIKRFTSMCGAKIPPNLYRLLEAASGDKEKVAEIGIAHAAAQCRELLQKKIPGIHFYTLNKSHATRRIFEQLKEEHIAG